MVYTVITVLSLLLNAYLIYKFKELKELYKNLEIKNRYMANYISDIENKKK